LVLGLGAFASERGLPFVSISDRNLLDDRADFANLVAGLNESGEDGRVNLVLSDDGLVFKNALDS